MDAREALARTPIFAQLERNLLDALACCAALRRYAPGDVLARERWPASACFVICRGEAVLVRGLGGCDEHVLRTLTEGDCFGEEALRCGSVRTASLRAKTDVECLVVARWDFRELAKAYPEFDFDTLAAASRRANGVQEAAPTTEARA